MAVASGRTVVYQNNYQFVPLERIGYFFEDVFGHALPVAVILQVNATCAEIGKIGKRGD